MASNKSLNNGITIPLVGMGTYDINGVQGVEIIKLGIDLGYRLIDTAFIYENEEIIGKAVEEKLKEGNVKREDLFIITKLWNTMHKPDDVILALKNSLKSLKLPYVDLYLMHWPFAQKGTGNESSVFEYPEEDVPFEDTWKAMEKCVHIGYARSIGVSNFNSSQVERILKIAEIKPVVNEIECNPYMSQERLRDLCKKKDLAIICHSPLYGQYDKVNKLNLLKEPIVTKIAEKYNKAPSQVVLRYLTQNDAIVIPKSSKENHLKSNINIFDFTLTVEELEQMRSLNKNVRASVFPMAAKFKEYPFSSEF